jgi:hypothetical protein
MTAMQKLGQGGFSIGLELPLDNDWSSTGRQAHAASGRVPGEPDLHQHAGLAMTSHMSASSNWTWTRIHPCRCSASASAVKRGAMA